MSSRRSEPAAPAVERFWRDLAQRAQWDVPTAARHLGLSLRQLERLCHRDFGCSPSEWFQCERMTTAARLLIAGEPAKQVALRLGYLHLSNFSRDFKRHHGRAPTRFAPRPHPFLPPQPPATG